VESGTDEESAPDALFVGLVRLLRLLLRVKLLAYLRRMLLLADLLGLLQILAVLDRLCSGKNKFAGKARFTHEPAGRVSAWTSSRAVAAKARPNSRSKETTAIFMACEHKRRPNTKLDVFDSDFNNVASWRVPSRTQP
jgi:hypothetical protein